MGLKFSREVYGTDDSRESGMRNERGRREAWSENSCMCIVCLTNPHTGKRGITRVECSQDGSRPGWRGKNVISKRLTRDRDYVWFPCGIETCLCIEQNEESILSR